MENALKESRGKVLLVDDDEALLKLGKAQLEQAGFQVCACQSGWQALAELASFTPDIALIDIMMPGMDGWQLCQRLKAGLHTAEIPIFFITCRGEEADLERHRRAGADGYFIKPFTAELLTQEILATLQRCMRKHQYWRN